MDEPAPVNKCLGCDHQKSTVVIDGREYNVHVWNMVPFMRQCIEQYLSLCPANTKLKVANTPFLDDNQIKQFSGKPGRLQPIATRVLMKLLYGARYARYDLLKAISLLATMITRWDEACDRSMHKMMCYVSTFQ